MQAYLSISAALVKSAAGLFSYYRGFSVFLSGSTDEVYFFFTFSTYVFQLLLLLSLLGLLVLSQVLLNFRVQAKIG